MKLKKPYNREMVLARLARHAIRPVHIQTEVGSVLSHLETPEDNHIGLKLWGYIDSLQAKVVRI